MVRGVQSGELFTGQLTAFLPRRAVVLNLEDAKASDKPCEWHPGGKQCVSEKWYWFRVNHILLSLCRFHAKRMAQKKGMEVWAVCERIAA